MKGTIFKSVAAIVLLVQCLTAPVQANFQPRIIGGQEININQVPATVAVLINSRLGSDNSFFQAQSCGGTLIGPTWVLTAAHCLFDHTGRQLQASELSILAGSTDLAAPVTSNTEVSQVIIHPGYRSVVFGDDIALLQLAEQAPASGIAMAGNRLPANEDVIIAGWGTVINIRPDGSGQFPNILRGAIVPTRAATECAALPGDYRFVDENTQICAGFIQGGIDSCQGDSGGPLYSRTANGGLQLAGITSWGNGCAFANQPGIYTDVFAYQDWIFQATGNATPTRIQEVEETNPQNNQDLIPQTNTVLRSTDSGSGGSLLFAPLLLLLIWFRSRVTRNQR